MTIPSSGGPPPGGPPPALSALLNGLDLIARWLVILAMTIMVGLVALQVSLRYGFSSSMMASDELARLSFVWAVFLAIPLGLRAKRHVVVEMLTVFLPAAARVVLGRVILVASAAILAIAGWQASSLAIGNWDDKLPTLELSAGLFFVAVAIGCLHSALHLLVAAAFGEAHPDNGSAP